MGLTALFFLVYQPLCDNIVLVKLHRYIVYKKHTGLPFFFMLSTFLLRCLKIVPTLLA